MDRKLIYSLGGIYFISCLICLFFFVPALDTLYYWDWGRHLALSYFDGPPMVAYITWAYQHIASTSIFSINLLSLLTNFLIPVPLYFLAKHIFNKKVALYSVAIWLLTYFTFIKYAVGYSYDTPITLFWMSTLALFYFAVAKKNNVYLYLCGISAGLMMLSKYTGILLYISLLLLCLTQKDYRPLLKNKHLYLAAALSVLVFSPVIIWNIQHGMASFSMQFHHGYTNTIQYKHLLSYLNDLIGNYNIFFIAFLLFIWQHRKNLHQDKRFALLFYPAVITLVFFALSAPFAEKYNWVETYYLSAVILIAYYFCETPKRTKMANLILIICSLIIFIFSITWMLNNTRGSRERYNQQALYTKVGNLMTANIPIIVDSYDNGAGLAFYAKKHPMVYGLSGKGNEYQYWRAPKSRTFYFVTSNNKLKPNCQCLGKVEELYVYHCSYA